MDLRFGIIGAGEIANKFAQAVAQVPGVRLAAVAARDAGRAAEFASRHGVPTSYGSYEALLRDEGIDAVYVALIHNRHFAAVRDSLEHGKAVLCEKPLVLTKGEAQQLAALSREKGVLLMEAMWTRFLPTYIQVKQWMEDGRIGRVRQAHTALNCLTGERYARRLYTPELAGGALYDVGVYCIEFITGLLGQNPTGVCGVADLGPTGVDELDAVSLYFEGGVVGNFTCGFTARGVNEAIILGTGGYIRLPDDFNRSQRAELYDKHHKLLERYDIRFENGFIYEIAHFRDLWLHGKTESPAMPLKDNIACAEIFEILLAQWHAALKK